MKLNPATAHLLFEVDDKPPHRLAVGLAAQVVAIILAGIALTPIIALGAAGVDSAWNNWVVFAALAVSGISTFIQARRLGPFGAGHILFMGTSGAFIAVSISALKAGGIPLLATLVLVSSLIQFAFAHRLSLFRRIINPTVGGTVICLIAVTVMPIGFDMVSVVPSGMDVAPTSPALVSVVTLAVIVLLSLYSSGKMRLWAPLIGILAGCLVAWPLGLVDISGVLASSWFGLPNTGWPGLDLSFDMNFWTLLPAFFIVTIVGALETYGDSMAIQTVSRRSVTTSDYRLVQGAVNADGLGNLLSGLVGTMPNTTYSTSISVVDMTGVAARRVGIYGGIILLTLAFIPKLSALLQAIPAPVAGIFIVVFLVLLFAQGARMVLAKGLSFDNGLVFGLSFWLGVGFQNSQIFSGLLPEFWAGLLNNGMTVGGISAVFLSWLVSLKSAKPVSHKTWLAPDGVGPVLEFVGQQGYKHGWYGRDLNRLMLAGEEAFSFLLDNASGGAVGQGSEAGAGSAGNSADNSAGNEVDLRLRFADDSVELEIITAPTGVNVESLLRDLSASQEEAGEALSSEDENKDDLSLRILYHMTDDLRHQQFNNADYLFLTLHRTAEQATNIA